MEFTPPEGHERVAECEARTIKEHVYSSILTLNHAVDEEMVDGRWSRVYAGQVAEFEVPFVNHNKQGTSREIGYVISHQGYNPVVRLLHSGERLKIRSGHLKVIDKSPAIHLME